MIFLLILVVIAALAAVVKLWFPVLLHRLFDSDVVAPGYFQNGLLLWGEEFSEETYVSKGIELVGLQDMRSLDDEALDELYQRNVRLLAMAQPGDAIKIQYTIEDDYETHLAQFDRDTDEAEKKGAPTWAVLQRRIVAAEFRERSRREMLSHEKVYLYWCRRANAIKEMGGKVNHANATRWLGQQSKNLTMMLEQVALHYGCSTEGVMGDEEHALHLRKWANPSLARYWAGGVGAVEDLDRTASIAQNVLSSETAPFRLNDDRVVLRMDGMYHAFYIVTGRSRGTDLKKTRLLLDAVHRGIRITETIYPLDPQEEIESAQSIINQLEREKSPKEGNMQVINDQQNDLRSRIAMLNNGQSLPYNVFLAIQVYAANIDDLSARTTALKTALTAMDGLRYTEVSHPETARRIFAETCPGWAGSSYRGWDLYWESYNLADLLPLSASFTGFLSNADALVYGDRGTVAGVRLWDRKTKTPLFAVNMGKTGTGKTTDAINIVTQAAIHAGFTAIFDEGLSWHTTASLLGLRTVILREGRVPTVNPFDTNGLPRTGTLYTEISSIGMALVGMSADNDVNANRKGLIVQYARALSDSVAEDYLKTSQKRELELARELAAVRSMLEKMKEESDLADGYVAWLDLQRTNPAEAQRRLDGVKQKDVIELTTDPALRILLRDYAYTRIKPAECPQWRQLVFMFTVSRLPIHTGPEVSETMRSDLETIGTRLQRGLAGAELGNFIDGVSTLQVEAPGLYVETSFLAKDSLLRSLAPMAILARVRRFIITQPRAVPKIVVLEEFKKLAETPGVEDATKESLGQFRKYAVWLCTNFQAPSQIDEVNPTLTNLLLGQSSQFWMHAMPATSDVMRVAGEIRLPAVACRAISGYRLLADQPARDKAPYMGLFVPTGNGTYVWGTSRNYANPYMLYVIDSSGENFDQRQEALRQYDDPYVGVISEVDRKLRASADPEQASAAGPRAMAVTTR